MIGMLKRWGIRLVFAFAVMVIGAVSGAFSDTSSASAGSVERRGVWVAFYEYSAAGLSNRTEAAFRKNAATLFKNIKSYGCNEVFFHVRAYDDAIYPSKITGWSHYISTDGKALSYDPLEILVQAAHSQGLKFHAWMNPYRVTTTKILNPAKTKTINRIVNQVKEIINNYQVDGIHFDDYFYLGTKYASVKASKRRKNVNKLIKKVYATVKAKSKDIEFGISPAGNYEYCMSIGADVKTWLSKSGYIDYLIPQIYWSDKYKMGGKYHKLFTERLELWRSLNKLDLPMPIGLAAYRCGYSTPPDYGWSKKKNNLKTQLQAIKAGNSEGYSLFAYTNLWTSHSKAEMKKFLTELSWIKLNSTAVTLKQGETFTFTAKWKPAKVTWGPDISFRSLDESIATVDENGVITAVAAEGTVKIQAYSGDKKKNCTVTIADGD
ncbi:MAG: family 10 glycosylhydrolase [Eubacterium sp.]|nr:family 10 glycosylhydrolase [Eubacterium sp.]